MATRGADLRFSETKSIGRIKQLTTGMNASGEVKGLNNS
jgi:hypothetical protein